MQLVSQILSLILVASFGGAVSSCKTLKPDKEQEADSSESADQAQMKVPVGSIHTVHPSGQFVLIRSSRFLDLEPGMTVTAHGNGGVETARVRISPAKKGQFMTADIISGNPAVGNQVLMDYTANRPTTAGSEPESTGRDEIQVLE